MEGGDTKGLDAPTPNISNPGPKEESHTLPAKADIPEKTDLGNGGVGGDKKAVEEKEKSSKIKEETTIKCPTNSNKQTESASNKQNNGKPVKSSRDEKYSRRKDERGVDQVMRSLNALETPQDKLDALVNKYAEVVDENRKLQTQTKNIERRLIQVEREKDSAQSEHSKAVLTRSRLEGLCRELQRQNRAIKEESVLKIREEEEKRKEVSNKFQSTLAEITSLMQQNNEKNSKLRDDNIEMTTKFKSVCEQYELRVQQVEKISKQMQLEAQLADAKLAKAQLESKAEKESLIREKHELLIDLAHYQARLKEQEQTELKLREQVELYTNKYDEFQTALSRSNEVFGGFKEEMDKMSKKIVKLEKETSTWKQRWEKSHQALLEMATDKQQRDAELSLTNRQLNQLHKLCRTLTEERAKLMAQINTLGKEPDSAKEEKLAADIAEDRRKLNDTLDSLQSVILERELLHKQQLLEKQQQQLQIELQKHIAASVGNTEPTAKPVDLITTGKADDGRSNESKAASAKTSEASKKKGKKPKSARSNNEKSSSPDEVKVGSKNTATLEENSSNGAQPAIDPSNLEKPVQPLPDPAVDSSPPVKEIPKLAEPIADLTNDSSPPPLEEIPKPAEHAPDRANEGSPPLLENILEPAVPTPDPALGICEPPSITAAAAEVAKPLQEAAATPDPAVTTPTVALVHAQPAPTHPARLHIADPTGSPVACSYAAAVGGKPAEQHAAADKLVTEKNEEKPAVPKDKTAPAESGNEPVRAVVSTDIPSKAEDVGEKPIPIAVENSETVAVETPAVAPSSVPSSKKSKKGVGQRLGIKGRTASLFRISKLLGCLKLQTRATQTHDTS